MFALKSNEWAVTLAIEGTTKGTKKHEILVHKIHKILKKSLADVGYSTDEFVLISAYKAKNIRGASVCSAVLKSASRNRKE